MINMILAGDQPDYLPYLGFFHKILNCNKYIIVDHVQFSKKSFQNRNRILSKNGEIMLTVPVLTKGKFNQSIASVEIDNKIDWQKKHMKTIFLNYHKSEFYDDYKDFFENIYSQKWNKLIELNEFIIRYICKKLEIDIPFFRSSDYYFDGKKTKLLVQMCKIFGCDIYLSGEGGRNYVDLELFKENKLTNYFTNFIHPCYKQLSKPFHPRMSIIDLILNNDIQSSRKILFSSGKIGK